MDANQRLLLLRLPMHTRPAVYAAMTGDSADNCPVQCANCGTVRPLSQSVVGRIAIDYAGPGLDPVGCSHPSSDSGQHFACDTTCLKGALDACWNGHIEPAHRAASAAQAQGESE